MFKNIPKHWEYKPLESYLTYEQPTKYIVESEDYNDNYTTPVLTAGKSFILGYTNETTGIYKNTPVIIFDDFTTDNKYVDFNFKVKSSAMKILKHDNQITLKYLYYLMQTIKFDSTQHKRYWISEYSKIKVPVPPTLEEQQEIVQVLDTMSDIIRLREECISHAQDLIPAIFQEMFGDVNNNTKNYNLYRIKDLGIVTTGSTPPSNRANMFGGNIPFITPADLESNRKHYLRYVTKEGSKNSRIVREGASLICCIGATIGKVDISKDQSCFNQQINAVEWNSELIDDKFGLYLLRQISPIIKANASQATLPILNKSKFENIKIVKPLLPLQKQFAQKAIEIENYIKEQQEELENAKQMFQSLLHHAFTGELTKGKLGENNEQT